MKLPKFHTALQIYFDINEGINRTVGFLEPFHFEFKTPELFQQLYPGTSNKIVYKAIQLDQADREQLLINQEREIQMTEILDGCPQLAVGFCYLRIFDQAFFFMNKPVMTLEKGFKQLNALSIQDNKKVVYKMCWQLSKGLEKMHSQNIMHRNINPGNITMDHEEILQANLSIAEFDRSKKAEQKGSSKSIIIQPSTQANCNSTFSYMPPDDPEKYTIKADLFQFGVVALQLANKGQYFGKGFFGLSVDEFEEFYGQEIIREQLKSLEYDDRFIECIGSCIKPNPQQRPNTNELSRTLYQVYLSSKIRIMPKETIIQQL